jgi:hypothetical protein
MMACNTLERTAKYRGRIVLAMDCSRKAMYKQYHLQVVGDQVSNIHRSRNFAEDLHHSLRRRGWGTTSDPDTMTSDLVMSIPHKRHHRDAMKLLADLMASHLMESEINVKELPAGSA